MLNTEIMPDLEHELERSLSCGLNPNQTPLMAERGTPAIAPSAPAMLFFSRHLESGLERKRREVTHHRAGCREKNRHYYPLSHS